jgi:hypothetical protein
MKGNAEKDSVEDFEFFVTTGDNIYTWNLIDTPFSEFETMMGLFNSRDEIKDVPIYPVRGNHDCWLDD